MSEYNLLYNFKFFKKRYTVAPMKVVILGAGQVGGSLSANLSSNGYDVTVIDSNDEKLSDLDSRLDLRTVSGHASHPTVSYTHLTLPTILLV